MGRSIFVRLITAHFCWHLFNNLRSFSRNSVGSNLFDVRRCRMLAGWRSCNWFLNFIDGCFFWDCRRRVVNISVRRFNGFLSFISTTCLHQQIIIIFKSFILFAIINVSFDHVDAHTKRSLTISLFRKISSLELL